MISIIVATDDDLLIGKKDSSNGMPWHNKALLCQGIPLEESFLPINKSSSVATIIEIIRHSPFQQVYHEIDNFQF